MTAESLPWRSSLWSHEDRVRVAAHLDAAMRLNDLSASFDLLCWVAEATGRLFELSLSAHRRGSVYTPAQVQMMEIAQADIEWTVKAATGEGMDDPA